MFSFKTADDRPYGSWPKGTELNFPEAGYFVLCGANNSGKTSFLQGLFRDNGGALLIPAERGVIFDNINPGTGLAQLRNNLRGSLVKEPLDAMQVATDGNIGQYASKLPNALINSGSIIPSVNTINAELLDFGLPTLEIRGEGTQQVIMGERRITQHGSGARSLLTILAALAHREINPLIIDEPEASLEPMVQKLLRDKLLQYADQKLILVATHSHLFLNRQVGQIENNYRVQKNEVKESQIIPCKTPRDLQDLTFSLLGNSLEDLFLPANYIIVEGFADQVIVKKILALINTENRLIQVVSAGGITNVTNKYQAISEQILPLIMSSSPYSSRVVALIDEPNVDAHLPTIQELEKHLEDRLVKLNQPSIEDYLPEELYRAADLDKEARVAEIISAKKAGDDVKERELKEDTSNKIAAKIEVGHLDSIPLIKEVVQKALDLK